MAELTAAQRRFIERLDIGDDRDYIMRECKDWEREADSFAEDPITVAYGVFGDMIGDVRRGHVERCKFCLAALSKLESVRLQVSRTRRW